jgi:outer membrane protein TolC
MMKAPKVNIPSARGTRMRLLTVALAIQIFFPLQVRSAWSDLRTAQSVQTAQAKNIKKAVRALELAKSRYGAGTGTQIDVLNAQTALTEARGSYVDALRDYSVARATLIRATGADLQH